MHFLKRASLAWRILSKSTDGSLMAHAKNELPFLDKDLEELILVFSTQGHSGASAGVINDMLHKLLKFEPMSPLTGEDDEWICHDDATGMYQNKRCSRVFKQNDRFGGQAYDLDGIVWKDPDGSCFTNVKSMVPITFPYTPKTEYRDAVPD